MPPEFAMRKSAWFVLALTLACGAGLSAQTVSAVRPRALTGPWQGTLQVGANASGIFVLSDGDAGAMNRDVASIRRRTHRRQRSRRAARASSRSRAGRHVKARSARSDDERNVHQPGIRRRSCDDATADGGRFRTPFASPHGGRRALAFEVATIRPSKPEAVGPNYLVQGHESPR